MLCLDLASYPCKQTRPGAFVKMCKAPVAVMQRRGSSGKLVVSKSSETEQQLLAKDNWSQLTDRLVASSTIPFSILAIPQIIRNFANISSGHAAWLSILSWEGYVSGLLGNTLMCCHFASRGESTAVAVQLIGILSNLTVLCQVAYANAMPLSVFWTIMAWTILSCSVNTVRALRPASPSKTVRGDGWTIWQLISGLIGFTLLPQVLWSTLVPGNFTWLPSLLGALCYAAWLGFQLKVNGGQVSKLSSTASQLPGGSATLMFALSPLPQLVRNLQNPYNLAGLSPASMAFGMVGNAFMMPRALFTEDPVWLAGSTWGCIVGGWLQLLCLNVSRNPSTGFRYLSIPYFLVATVSLMTYIVAIALTDARIKGKNNPFQVLQAVYAKKTQ